MKLSELTADPTPQPKIMKLSDITGSSKGAPDQNGYDRALAEQRAIEKGRGPINPDVIVSGMTFGASDRLAEGETGLLTAGENLVGRMMGHAPAYTASDAMKAERQAVEEDRKAHPISSGAGTLLGNVVSPVNEVLGPANGLLGAVRSGAFAGGLQSLFDGRGDIKDRAIETAAGAAGGAAGGAALHGAGNLAGMAYHGVDAMTGHKIGDVLSQALGRAGAAVTGKPFVQGATGAERAAVERIRDALQKDRVSPEKIEAAVQAWAKAGNEAPELIAVAGPNTKAVIRAAGTKLGDSRTALVDHREGTRANIAAREAEHTTRLTGDNKSLAQHKAELEHRRDNLAEEEFREPYSHPVKLTPEIEEVIGDKEGLEALSRADRAAGTRQDRDRQAEIRKLRDYFKAKESYQHKLAEWESGAGGTFAREPDAETKRFLEMGGIPESVKDTIRQAHGWTAEPKPEPPKPPEVSGGTLHRIQIAFGGKGATAQRQGANDVASGWFDRQSRLGEQLDSVPHLSEARATYHDLSNQIKAADWTDHILNMTDRKFKYALEQMTPEARKVLEKVAEEQFLGKAGGTTRQAMAISDQVSAPNSHAASNIKALFGDERGQKYIDAMRNERDRLRAANYVAPDTGSQTHDRGAVHRILNFARASHSWPHALALIADGASTMSAPEADAIAKMGVGPASSVLDQLKLTPSQASALRRALAARAPVVAGAQAGKATSDVAGNIFAPTN